MRDHEPVCSVLKETHPVQPSQECTIYYELLSTPPSSPNMALQRDRVLWLEGCSSGMGRHTEKTHKKDTNEVIKGEQAVATAGSAVCV